MRQRRAATLILALLLGAPQLAHAEQGGADPSAKLQIVIPTALGKWSWGTKRVTKALRRELEGVGTQIPEETFTAKAGELGLRGAARWSLANIARTGKEVGAHYVLFTSISKKGWLYTARSILVNCGTGTVDMDFRSDYYKPNSEAADRGRRIGRKTREKIGLLIRSQGIPVLKPAETAVVDSTPSGTDTTGTDTTDTETAGTETTETTGTESTGTETTETTGTESTETTDTASTDTTDTSGSDESMDFDNTDFAAEFADSGADAEFDGFTDEGGWTWNMRGWVGAKYFGFLHPDLPDTKSRHFAKIGFRSTLTGKLGPNARLRVLPLFEADLLNQRIHRVIIEEGFLEYNFDVAEIRIGWDSLSWGSASAVHVVDVINARDFSEGVTDSPKVGQPMLSLKFLFGNHSLSFLYITPFLPPSLPLTDTPFSPFDEDAVATNDTPVFASDFEEWHPQAAARLALAFSGVDLRASYFYGYARFPLLHPTTGTQFYPLMHHASVDTQLLFGQTSIKAEAAFVHHQSTDRHTNPPITLANGRPAASIEVPGDRVNWVIGLEHTFDDFIGGSTFVPIVEFIGDSDSPWFTDHRPADDITRFFQNHLVYGFNWSFDNRVGSEIQFADIMDLRFPGDHLFSLEYQERWFQHFTFVVGGRLGIAGDNHKMTAFRQLSGVFTELRINY